jgi:uncharacterized protein (TIGR03086 family)
MTAVLQQIDAALDMATGIVEGIDTPVRLSFGTLPGPMAALVHLTEILGHGADLAVSTGREDRVDQARCEELLTVMQAMDFAPFRRPGMFGPELPVTRDAAAHRRLLAFLGRDLAGVNPPAPGYDRGAGSIGDDVPRSIVV